MPATRPRIALGPDSAADWLADAVREGGGDVVDPTRAEAVVWADPRRAGELRELLDRQPGIAWVQLPWAGVEPYVEVFRAHPDRLWTCGKGVYAEPVAEHALAMGLAGLRGLAHYARQVTWSAQRGTNLVGARVVVLGGGAITESLLRFLGPFGAEVTVVRRTPAPLQGADRVVGPGELDEVLVGAELVVLALALTPDTQGVMNRSRLERLAPHGWVVNVARGAHIVTDDLVAVLAEGRIGGAALDVVDPEPLPDSHPLWNEPRCLITPHTANTAAMAVPLLSERVRVNVARWAAREPLVGPIDVEAGY